MVCWVLVSCVEMVVEALPWAEVPWLEQELDDLVQRELVVIMDAMLGGCRRAGVVCTPRSGNGGVGHQVPLGVIRFWYQ